MKKITFTRLLFFFIFLTAITSSCDKKTELEFPKEEQKITVLCNFSPDQPFSIELSTSKSIAPNSSNILEIENAIVEICKGDDQVEKIPETSELDGKVRFLSMQSSPKTDEIYTLKINADGLPPIIAKSSIPQPIKIEHTALGEIFEENLGPENIGYHARIALNFFDPVGEKNYYQINFYQELANANNVQDSSVQLAPIFYFEDIDESIAGDRNVLDGGVLIKDFTFDGTSKELVFEPYFVYNKLNFTPRNIVVELRTVSEEYFQYYTSIYRQVNQVSNAGVDSFNENVPFSDPNIISSNIKNGYGIFAGYSKSTTKVPTGF